MAETVGDPALNAPKADQTAVLLLEHKMVSRRLGFESLTDALSISSRIRDRIYEGDSAELKFFAKIILPLVESSQSNDIFETMKTLRNNKSPLLSELVFSENETYPLQVARLAEKALGSTTSNCEVSLLEVLASIPARFHVSISMLY